MFSLELKGPYQQMNLSMTYCFIFFILIDSTVNKEWD